MESHGIHTLPLFLSSDYRNVFINLNKNDSLLIIYRDVNGYHIYFHDCQNFYFMLLIFKYLKINCPEM